MKRLLFISLLLPCFGFGQNLVPNPSFEDTVTCPSGSYEIDKVVSWSTYGATPDYYHACAPAGNASVPSNFSGYQDAADGEAYCGIITWQEGEPPYIGREVIGAQLTTPLTIGQKYYVSFKATFTVDPWETCCAANKLGVRFSTVSYSNATPAPVNNLAHIYTDTIIQDSINWTTISGSFIADSLYEYIAIGNFFDIFNTDTMNLIDSNFYSYYFIDDVCVSTDSTLCGTIAITVPVPRMPNRLIYPNPTEGKFRVESLEFGVETIEIYDLFGRLLLRSNKKEIDMSSYPSGLYVWQVGAERGKLVLE